MATFTADIEINSFAIAAAGVNELVINGNVNAQITLRSGNNFRVANDSGMTEYVEGIEYILNNRHPKEPTRSYWIETLAASEVLQVVIS